MELDSFEVAELKRMQSRIIGKLQQAFSTDFKTGAEAFSEAVEELKELEVKYYKDNELKD